MIQLEQWSRSNKLSFIAQNYRISIALSLQNKLRSQDDKLTEEKIKTSVFIDSIRLTD